MAAQQLYDVVAGALAVTGPVEWHYRDAAGDSDRLEWVEEEGDTTGMWVLVCPDPQGDEEVEDIVVEEAMARDLVAIHLQRWLAERGWQVQMGFRRGEPFWRLADCLSLREGGGDRLDADYPEGTEEVAVLAESVVTVATQALPPLPIRSVP